MLAWALTRDLHVFVNSLYYAFNGIEEWIPTPVETEEKKLAVLVHGLKGNKRNWFDHVTTLSAKGWDLYVPDVHNGGDCSLVTAAKPIVDYVKKLVEPQPGEGEAVNQPKDYKKIVLIGTSNGTRIIHSIYRSVDWKDDVDVRMIPIAGFFTGIPWLKSIDPAMRLMFSADLVNEFTSDAPVPYEYLEPQKTLYVATTHDTRMIPITSSIPSCAIHYVLAEREGHCSVHHATLPLQIAFIELERLDPNKPFRYPENIDIHKPVTLVNTPSSSS